MQATSYMRVQRMQQRPKELVICSQMFPSDSKKNPILRFSSESIRKCHLKNVKHTLDKNSQHFIFTNRYSGK